jgi:hypothetical protein
VREQTGARLLRDGRGRPLDLDLPPPLPRDRGSPLERTLRALSEMECLDCRELSEAAREGSWSRMPD